MKLKEQLVSVYRTYRSRSKLYHRNWRDYRSLYVYSGVITVTVIVSLFRSFADTLLKLGGIPYLSTATLPLFKKSAWVLIPLALIVVLLFYVAYFQYSVILLGIRDIRNDRFSLPGTFKQAFLSTVHASPVSILLLAVNMLIILPIAGSMFPTDVFSNLTVPDYVYEFWMTRWYLIILMLVFIVVLYRLALRFYLVLPLTVLKGFPAKKAFSISSGMMKGHKWKTLVQLTVLALLFLGTELLVFIPTCTIQVIADLFGGTVSAATCVVMLSVLKLFAAYYSIRISIIMFFTTYPEDMFEEERIQESKEQKKERTGINRILAILSGIGMVLMAVVYSLWFIISYSSNIPLVVANAGVDGNNGVPNTIEVMRETARSAYPDYSAVTVQRTKDGCFAVIGPDDLFQYCRVSGSVSDLTLNELTSLPAVKGEFVSHYSSAEDYLRAAVSAGQKLILELDPSTVNADTVDDFLEICGPQILLYGHILQSSDYSTVRRILEINEELISTNGERTLTYQVGCTLYNSILYPAVDTDCIAIDDTNVQQMFINKGKIHQQNIYVWNADDSGTMDRMILMNVDGIYTNYPSLLRERISALQNSGYTAILEKFVYKYFK